MLKEIVTVPDEILKKISDPIEKVGINEKKLIYNYHTIVCNHHLKCKIYKNFILMVNG